MANTAVGNTAAVDNTELAAAHMARAPVELRTGRVAVAATVSRTAGRTAAATAAGAMAVEVMAVAGMAVAVAEASAAGVTVAGVTAARQPTFAAPLAGAFGAPAAGAAAPAGAAPAATGNTAPDQTGTYAGSGTTQSAMGGGYGSMYPRIVPNPYDNTIIIQGTPQQWEQIKHLMEQLDIAPRQVQIDAKIYEVDLTGDFSLGVEAFLQKKGAANTSVPAFQLLGTSNSAASRRTPVDRGHVSRT